MQKSFDKLPRISCLSKMTIVVRARACQRVVGNATGVPTNSRGQWYPLSFYTSFPQLSNHKAM